MIYALLSTGSLGVIVSLVLLIQRNQARTERDTEKRLGDEAERVITIRNDEIRRLDKIIQNLNADVIQLTQERNELAKNDPAAAGKLLAGVLASDGNDSY